MGVETAGAPVRSVYNAAKVGISTGRCHRLQGTTYVYVRYPSGEEEPIPIDELEIAPLRESRAEALSARRYSAPNAVARAVITEKLRGQLTDVIYAMGSGITEFFPHQFRPVLTFFSSTIGRILVADEVGLGKTIEAIYIWRELQARAGARRLLVVCPAVLRRKWQSELRDRFSIDAPIVKAFELLELVQGAARDPSKSFFAIAGLESIRVRRADLEESERRSMREELGAFLLANEAETDFALFDLVVIDEAHYMRNPETANHNIGQLLAAASANLVLLTATPIQIGSENLFNLLRLVDPDRFPSVDAFERIRQANATVTKALNAVRHGPLNMREFSAALSEIASNRFFRSDHLIEQWTETPPDLTSLDERVYVARLLEERSLLASVLVRTRKRDVVQNRVIRDPKVIRIRLSATERAVYDGVTGALRRRAYRADTANALALIARQRQLASSIPAAVANWRENPDTAELLAEDLGFTFDTEEPRAQNDDRLPEIVQVDPSSLEANDTKFMTFRGFLRDWFADHSADKVIVFSFFRGTLRYLQRRLRDEGVETALIWGGMGDAKDDEIARFADPRGPNVLLSSEVGSEGIDLQFSRVVVNYDLPWNPMRVEQRIGRIDRLGQKSDTIKIVTFLLMDTIEEIILERLYERIGVFKESIGELEEILGQSIDELVIEYFRDGLTDEQVAERLGQNALAAAQHKRAVSELEEEAPDLVGNMDFILSSIQAGREAGRWIRPEDLRNFLSDFLFENYPGSQLEADHQESGLYRLSLSPSAGAALGIFMDRARPTRGTRLRAPGAIVPVVFDPACQTKFRPRPELIDITHPIVAFARTSATERASTAEPVAAMVIPGSLTEASPGVYVFATDLWRFNGLRRDIRLQSLVMSVLDGGRLDSSIADKLIDVAVRRGARADLSEFPDIQEAVVDVFGSCEKELEDRFMIERHDFRQENARRVEQARLLVADRSESKIAQLREILEQQRRSDDERRRRASQMTDGRIKKLIADRDQRLARIEATALTETTRRGVAGGVIIVE
jgi:superfamily II DNA or RNA helicase